MSTAVAELADAEGAGVDMAWEILERCCDLDKCFMGGCASVAVGMHGDISVGNVLVV